MKQIPSLKKKAIHKHRPDALAMALSWDKVAKESFSDADLVGKEEMEDEQGEKLFVEGGLGSNEEGNEGT